MLYLNKDFPIQNKGVKGNPIICITIRNRKGQDIIVPLPRSFGGKGVLEKGLHEDLCISYTKNCNIRIDYSSKKYGEKYLFCILDTECDNKKYNGSIYIEYEQYRCNEIERMLSTTKESKGKYFECLVCKIPNNRKVRYIKINYSNGESNYIITNELKLHEVKVEEVYLDDELKFDNNENISSLGDIKAIQSKDVRDLILSKRR